MAGLFSSVLFLVVCILDAFGHLFGTEAGCNWCLHDINIFTLSKNTTTTNNANISPHYNPIVGVLKSVCRTNLSFSCPTYS